MLNKRNYINISTRLCHTSLANIKANKEREYDL